MQTGTDTQVIDGRAAAVSGVLGRLLYAPRSRPQEAVSRLRLVERLLRSGGGYWRAEDLADTPEEIPDMRVALKELRRIGLLGWDENHGGYAFDDRLRVPVALTLLACADDDPAADQLTLLDMLVPFAQLATRGDLRGAPAWAMLDLLERDVRLLEDALAAGPEQLEQLAQDRWLIRSAQDMEEAIERLRALENADLPGVSQLVTRAVQLLTQAGERVARLSVRMSRSTRDRLRLPGSKRSPRELRDAALALDTEELALVLASSVGVAPSVVQLPDEDDLAALAPAELADHVDLGPREYPNAQQLQAPPPADEPPPAPDAHKVAGERLAGAPPRRMAAHLFGDLSWLEAVRLQHGLVRVQGEAARRGVPGWHALPEPVHLDDSPVAWLWEIERAA